MASQEEVALAIEGMTCGNCVRHVQAALARVPGVAAVSVDLARGEARLSRQPGTADLAALVAAVEAAGYGAKPKA
jgi:copper chaperone CopZ